MSLIEQQYLFKHIYTFLFQYRVELKLFQLDKDNSNTENYFLVDPVNKYVRSTRLSLFCLLYMFIETRNALNKYLKKKSSNINFIFMRRISKQKARPFYVLKT